MFALEQRLARKIKGLAVESGYYEYNSTPYPFLPGLAGALVEKLQQSLPAGPD
jgi:hypothetical protein